MNGHALLNRKLRIIMSEKTEIVRLSAKKEKVILLLLSNHTISYVAKRIGLNKIIIYGWLTHSQERLQEERNKLSEQAIERLYSKDYPKQDCT